MKKITLLATTLCLLLVMLAGCGQSTQAACDICGRNHQADFAAGRNGAPSLNAFFEVFTTDPFSNEFLRIFVESCWSGSVTPEYRLNFIARYDIANMYEAISVADSNAPFEVAFDGETITISTDIPGLEEIFITLDERQREVGFAYNMRRRERYEQNIADATADDVQRVELNIQIASAPSPNELLSTFDHFYPADYRQVLEAHHLLFGETTEISNGVNLAIWADVTLYDVGLLFFGNDIIDGEIIFIPIETFSVTDILMPGMGVVISPYVGFGTLPWSGVTFLDENGLRRYFSIIENTGYPYEGGDLWIIQEFENRTDELPDDWQPWW